VFFLEDLPIFITVQFSRFKLFAALSRGAFNIISSKLLFCQLVFHVVFYFLFDCVATAYLG
ncbi:MAG TPA: hypothetical protein PL004_12140, partial [Bacillota bacterium]|nr:hypothetical protein [Bacillota bacterium]